MKRLYKFLSLVFVCSGIVFYSCETTNLNLTKNPNALTPSQADADFLLNGIQVNFGRLVEDLGERGAQLTRIDYMSGRDYPGVYSPSGFDTDWRRAYQGVLNNIRAMQPIATNASLTKHLGMAQFIEAYTMVSLVDFFGDVPYTEAVTGINNLNPKADSGASIYDAALGLLDQAIANFNAPALGTPQIDFFYAGDFGKWIKAANSLKMKIYMQRRLVDANAIASFNAIVSSGNFISNTADDMDFHWAKSDANPDARHPRYAADYTTSGANNYESNWLMGYMDRNNDPRIRYYFYRQVDGMPGQLDVNGNPVPPDEQTSQCSLRPTPQHYLAGGFTFCGLPDGYWGRDHGDDDGIPPDGFLRTVVGVYPAAGEFDDDSFANRQVNPGNGGGGAGITPIMLASTSHFLLAEVAMVAGDMSTAKSQMAMGIDESIKKVQAFGSGLDPDADPTFEPSALAIASFKTAMGDAFDNAATTADKWNVLAQQFFVSLFGNGIDAYNFYRRTGYPTTLQPNIEPNPGTFIRSNWYPAAYANTNSNATQKSGVSVQVFWDTNPPSPGFPLSN